MPMDSKQASCRPQPSLQPPMSFTIASDRRCTDATRVARRLQPNSPLDALGAAADQLRPPAQIGGPNRGPDPLSPKACIEVNIIVLIRRKSAARTQPNWARNIGLTTGSPAHRLTGSPAQASQSPSLTFLE